MAKALEAHLVDELSFHEFVGRFGHGIVIRTAFHADYIIFFDWLIALPQFKKE